MKRIFAIAIAGALSACATTPDQTYHYYPAKSLTTFTVTQTITCTKDNSNIVVSTTPQTPSTIFMADVGAGTQDLSAKALDGSFSDSSVTVTLSEDGRLKGLNATETGQGQAILNSAMSLISAGLKAGSVAPAVAPGKGAKKPSVGAGCDVVQDNGGTITFTYATAFEMGLKYTPRGNPDYVLSDLAAYVNDKTTYARLKKALDDAKPSRSDELPTVSLDLAFSPNDGGTTSPCGAPQPTLKLRKTINVVAQFKADGSPIANTLVTVPGRDSYCIQLPKAAAFGTGISALTLSDSGAILTVQNNKTNGDAQALGTAQTIVTTIVPPSSPPPGGP